ncbi:RecT family recombinase [Rheinheimera sp. MMS21-TC3]|uniref:RecT family recombinase n=1 Tax=Rheinheimera sp. MMS21-TC3 TaxID=3072790 RepID=UPI0028C3C59D|nr:RecT family recombinase [Rheinheimera sp. MMS21-TC3]WNO60413.1 RecT family recombinase [Rheinheimera sp. MMS21-TC3]
MTNLAVVDANADVSTGTANMLMNQQTMQSLYKFAEVMASGNVTVPKHLQKSTADCLAVAMQAAQWGMNPFAVAQKTHLVNGTLGYEAQLVNAVLQSSGSVVGRFHYEYDGEGQKLSCRVGAIPRGETEVVFGQWLCIADVKIQNSPLWKTNPKQQLGYLQVKNWGRAYAPGAILGVYTPDELQEMPEREINPAPQATNGAPVAKTSLKARKAATKQEPAIEAEQVVTAQAQSSHAVAPNFDDEPEVTANNPDFTNLLEELGMCIDNNDFKRWKASVAELFTNGSHEYTELVKAYNNRVAQIKETQAKQGE